MIDADSGETPSTEAGAAALSGAHGSFIFTGAGGARARTLETSRESREDP